MIIYLSHSIRGVPGAPQTNRLLRETVINAGHTPADKLRITTTDTGDAHVYRRDLIRMNQSHGMIAELSGPSHGVGFEICYAHLVHPMPILCLVPHDSFLVSAMIAGCQHIYYYRDDAHLVSLVNDWLHDLEAVLDRHE